MLLPANDGSGNGLRALTALWAEWMAYSVPRIRSAVLATKPLQPLPHQDEAVFTHMLPQPRLRFLLADEPGTGKTIMTGMYLAEGRRRGLIPGKVIVVVPAHLVEKWIRDLGRYFGIEAMRITAEMGRTPQVLRPDIDVWAVSLDLFTHNDDVRRKVAGERSSWSVAVFDEAHRLTPTSQHLRAAHHLVHSTHHCLLLTATPHRGNETFFRALLHLLDKQLYPLDETAPSTGRRLVPGRLNFLRRMKEELVDVKGAPLFRARHAETRSVHLTSDEAAAYSTVMAYADEWYGERATLARSVYGKRAASSVWAALETLRRRRDALGSGQAGTTQSLIPEGFEDVDLAGAAIDDDEAWERAEEAVVESRSRDRRAERTALDAAIDMLERTIRETTRWVKWDATQEILVQHEIAPGEPSNQLLVFTEFVDTARWLRGLFAESGFSVEVLEGSLPHVERDALQQRFLSQRFQVLVSTDAGGEGIDLQSANVMVNWDIPWSLVRLEQRMGRLHRIGQERDVFIYHLVAPATREGRVQEVILQNLEAAGRALNGRIFDLLDATVEALGFDYTRALTEAQRSVSGGLPLMRIPDATALVAKAQQLAADEDRLRTPADFGEAQRRFAADRIEAINPVIVEAFLRQLAATEGWHVGAGPAKGILQIHAGTSLTLPTALGGGAHALVSADGNAVRHAWELGVDTSGIVVLGPTEPAFRDLIEEAVLRYQEELRRGATLNDGTSLNDYALFAFTAEVESSGGESERRRLPFLVRYSAGEAFPAAWESVLRLTLPAPDSMRGRPEPAARGVAQEEARQIVAAEREHLKNEYDSWVSRALRDLEEIETRYRSQIREHPDEVRQALQRSFVTAKQERIAQLERLRDARVSEPQLTGWALVVAAATADVAANVDSERVAITRVVRELEAQGFDVDDRQTAGVGYDLFARHRRTAEQRLVEVKGLAGELRAVMMEEHEWAQAQQRGSDYWLYVVTFCEDEPSVLARVQDPAQVFGGGTRAIQRFQIPASRLREVATEA